LVLGALQAIMQSNVRVPDELSFVGFGNADWFTLLRPALTTVALPIENMAIVAAHQLLNRIRIADSPGVTTTKTPVVSRYQAHLIVRDSTRQLEMS
ncbi:MAG: transcriptional regulator, LacI family, partial [Chloroflexi bacterium]|nr:transcriptional regulator, LacI family [Chloroflexota bacterium]